jgi:hypothetical protein
MEPMRTVDRNNKLRFLDEYSDNKIARAIIPITGRIIANRLGVRSADKPGIAVMVPYGSQVTGSDFADSTIACGKKNANRESAPQMSVGPKARTVKIDHRDRTNQRHLATNKINNATASRGM